MNSEDGRKKLDEAFDALEDEVPQAMRGTIVWLRSPSSRWVRIPVGILCLIAGFFWFLPVVGLEFFPIGLLLIAQDVPFLRGPVGSLTLWLIGKWRDLRFWWAKFRARN
jgi:hypothetical protein